MSLEDICSVKAFLCRASTAGAETADHRPLVVRQSVSVLVVFTSEAFDVIFASRDRALLGSFLLMGEHMCFQVLHVSAASRDWTHALVGLF